MKIVKNKAEQESMKYEDLDEGTCFKFDEDADDVFIKTGFEQDAVSLVDGEYKANLCGEDVFPVNAEVHIID